MLWVAISIANAEAKKHFQEILDLVPVRLGCAEPYKVVDLGCDKGQSVLALKNYFQGTPGGKAILIADWLTRSPGYGEDNTFAKECEAEFANELFGTIAIMLNPHRMPDIDRTIPPDSTGVLVGNTLKLVVDRLHYLAAPAISPRIDSQSITVRPLRVGNVMEFRSYFLLRKRVYTVMGYLDEEVEDGPRLEVNEADVHSIHIGAFYRDGARDLLVGTARVVATSEADEALQAFLERVVDRDPVARQRLDRAYWLGLPIFQSHKGMNPAIQEACLRNQICGELSRVIVAPEFRGLGISTRLIEEAVVRSINRGIQRLFLECLPIHEQLYAHHGFQRICGVEGRIVDVGRTVIAMEKYLLSKATVVVNLGREAIAEVR